MENSEENFRSQLADTIKTLSDWSKNLESDAIIAMQDSADTWLMKIDPLLPSACPYQLIFKSNRTYGVRLDDQVFDDTPLTDFHFPENLSYAVANGFIERHELRNALTNQLVAIEMFARLEPNAAWRKIGCQDTTAETPVIKQIKRYLPYRR